MQSLATETETGHTFKIVTTVAVSAGMWFNGTKGYFDSYRPKQGGVENDNAIEALPRAQPVSLERKRSHRSRKNSVSR